MKQLIRIIVIQTCFAFLTFSAFSQIPNPGFENWTNVGFPSRPDPVSWGNLNGATAITGTYTCERGSGADAYSGSYSLKLTSKSIFGQNAPGIAVTGNINTGTQELEGGFTYTQRPTHLAGWYKYAPASGDRCEVRVTLWRRVGGVLEDVGVGVLYNSAAVPSYTRFLVPITYTSANAPDSGRILLVSTDTDDIKIGSQLIVDDLEFLFIDCSTIDVSVTATDVTYVGADDGSATANVTGGAPAYTYTWDSGETTPSISNLPAGNYCVTVEDANGCTATACGAVSDPDCSSFSLTMDAQDATTTGGSDGSAQANVSGGAAPYAYLWDDGSTTDEITNLSKGIYCVTVMDNVGCEASECVPVGDPGCASFFIAVAAEGVSAPGANDGLAVAEGFGGTPPYTYLWNDNAGSNTDSLQNLSGGEYCVTVTDAENCQLFDCVIVFEPTLGILTLNEKGVKLFPNPATHAVTIELEAATPHRFRLLDISGRVMMEQTLNMQSTVVPIEVLPAGNYLVEIKNLSSGDVATGKLRKE